MKDLQVWRLCVLVLSRKLSTKKYTDLEMKTAIMASFSLPVICGHLMVMSSQVWCVCKRRLKNWTCCRPWTRCRCSPDGSGDVSGSPATHPWLDFRVGSFLNSTFLWETPWKWAGRRLVPWDISYEASERSRPSENKLPFEQIAAGTTLDTDPQNFHMYSSLVSL